MTQTHLAKDTRAQFDETTLLVQANYGSIPTLLRTVTDTCIPCNGRFKSYLVMVPFKLNGLR